MTVPAGLPGRPLAGDDSTATAPPWTQSSTAATSFSLPDGYRMDWLRGNAPLHARYGMPFRFRLVDPQGHPPTDMALYMGMLRQQHSSRRTELSSPTSIPWALHRWQRSTSRKVKSTNPANMDMPNMDMSAPASTLPNEVSFP